MKRPLALAVVLGIAVLPGLASAKPRVAIVQLEGDPGGEVQDVVMSTLDGDLSLVGPKEVNRTVDKLGLDSDMSDKDLKKLANELEADAVVQGKVSSAKDDHRLLHFKLFAKGKRLKGFKIEFNNVNSDKFKSALHDKMVEKLGGEETASGGKKKAKKGEDDSGDDAKPAAKNKKKVKGDDDDADSKVAAKSKKTKKGGDDDGDDSKPAAKKKGKGDDDDADTKVAAKTKKTKKGGDDDSGDDAKPSKKKGDDDSGDDAKSSKKVASDDSGDDAKKKGDDDSGDDTKPAKKKRTAHRGEDDGDDASVTASVEVGGKGAARAANRDAVRVDAGASFENRSLSFNSKANFPEAPKTYKNSPVPGGRVDGELFPFAFGDPKSLAAGIGAYGAYDRTIELALTNTSQPGKKFAVAQDHWEAGLEFRVPFGQSATAPSMTLTAGYLHRQFVVDHQGLNPGIVIDIPNVVYKGFDPGAQFRIPIIPAVAFVLGGQAVLVRSDGAIGENIQYGQATVTGGQGEAGVDIVIANRYALRLVGEFCQIGYKFNGGAAQTNNRDMDPSSKDVGGAIDRYIGGSVTLGGMY